MFAGVFRDGGSGGSSRGGECERPIQSRARNVRSAVARMSVGLAQPMLTHRVKAGAGSRDRTGILSLEGCCTTIVLYPRQN